MSQKRWREMMNAKTTIKGWLTGCAVVLFLLVAASIWFVITMFTHKVYHGREAIDFVLSDRSLAGEWKLCELGTNVSDVIQVTAARGVLQSGSRFCATVEVDSDKWSNLWRQLSLTNDTQLLDDVLALCIIGKQFTVSARQGWDGPEVLGMVDGIRTNRITYYGYAGDG